MSPFATYGGRLKSLRTGLCLSAEDLARKSGLALSSVLQAELATSPDDLSRETHEKIVEALTAVAGQGRAAEFKAFMRGVPS